MRLWQNAQGETRLKTMRKNCVHAACPGRDTNPGRYIWAPTQEPCMPLDNARDPEVPPAQGGIQIMGERVTDPGMPDCRQPRAGSWARDVHNSALAFLKV